MADQPLSGFRAVVCGSTQGLGRACAVEMARRGAEVTLFARDAEALSRVCLEWMSVGRPVVATAVGCLPEMVSTGETGFLVPSHNPKSLADCLLGLIRNPAFRREMGENARRAARNRFGMERFSADTDNVYFDALMRRTRFVKK